MKINARWLPQKKVLYVIFLENKGPVMRIPVPKGRTVTAKVYKNVVLRKLNKYYKTRRPKTGQAPQTLAW